MDTEKGKNVHLSPGTNLQNIYFYVCKKPGCKIQYCFTNPSLCRCSCRFSQREYIYEILLNLADDGSVVKDISMKRYMFAESKATVSKDGMKFIIENTFIDFALPAKHNRRPRYISKNAFLCKSEYSLRNHSMHFYLETGKTIDTKVVDILESSGNYNPKLHESYSEMQALIAEKEGYYVLEKLDTSVTYSDYTSEEYESAEETVEQIKEKSSNKTKKLENNHLSKCINIGADDEQSKTGNWRMIETDENSPDIFISSIEMLKKQLEEDSEIPENTLQCCFLSHGSHDFTQGRGTLFHTPKNKDLLYLDMKNFTHRLLSMCASHMDLSQKFKLAKAGFSFSGNPSTVECVFCRAAITSVPDGVSEFEMHQLLSKNCSLLTNNSTLCGETANYTVTSKDVAHSHKMQQLQVLDTIVVLLKEFKVQVPNIDKYHSTSSDIKPNMPKQAKTRKLESYVVLKYQCQYYEPPVFAEDNSPHAVPLDFSATQVQTRDNRHRIDGEGYKYEDFSERLNSFDRSGYTRDHCIMLAEAGFFNNGENDQGICFQCGISLSHLQTGVDPWQEHAVHQPECMHVKRCKGTEYIKHATMCFTETCNVLYPQYEDYSSRLNSFKESKAGMSQTPENLSSAGFYYTGEGDKVRCFYCGGGLCSWDKIHDPWTEHARWFPFCKFLMTMVGTEFVKAVSSKHKDTFIHQSKTEGYDVPARTQTLESQAVAKDDSKSELSSVRPAKQKVGKTFSDGKHGYKGNKKGQQRHSRKDMWNATRLPLRDDRVSGILNDSSEESTHCKQHSRYDVTKKISVKETLKQKIPSDLAETSVSRLKNQTAKYQLPLPLLDNNRKTGKSIGTLSSNESHKKCKSNDANKPNEDQTAPPNEEIFNSIEIPAMPTQHPNDTGGNACGVNESLSFHENQMLNSTSNDSSTDWAPMSVCGPERQESQPLTSWHMSGNERKGMLTGSQEFRKEQSSNQSKDVVEFLSSRKLTINGLLDHLKESSGLGDAVYLIERKTLYDMVFQERHAVSRDTNSSRNLSAYSQSDPEETALKQRTTNRTMSESRWQFRNRFSSSGRDTGSVKQPVEDPENEKFGNNLLMDTNAVSIPPPERFRNIQDSMPSVCSDHNQQSGNVSSFEDGVLSYRSNNPERN